MDTLTSALTLYAEQDSFCVDTLAETKPGVRLHKTCKIKRALWTVLNMCTAAYNIIRYAIYFVQVHQTRVFFTFCALQTSVCLQPGYTYTQINCVNRRMS